MLKQTKFIKDISNKEEFFSIKQKYFAISKFELHEDLSLRRHKYERKYFENCPLIKLTSKYNENYEDKFAVILSIDECLEAPYLGQLSYNILLDNEKITIMGYHIESVINGI